MSHFSPSRWYVDGHMCYVSDQMYLDLLEFTNPDHLKVPSTLETDIGMIMASINGENFMHRQQKALKLNPSGSQLWQFNALTTLDGQRNYIRCVAAFGSGDIYVSSMLDIYVKFPLYAVLAKLLNYTLYFQNKREYAAWEKFVSKVHSKLEEKSL
jgi:hypothetical protein